MSRLNDGLYSSSDQTWMTPPDVWQPLLDFLKLPKFDIDVCCTKENIPARLYLKEHEVDSLQVDWSRPAGNFPFPADPICWMNPPYGDALELFLRKAYEESQKGCRIWALVPARTETVYQHEAGLTKAGFTVFLYQRISFIPSEALREKLVAKHSEKITAKWLEGKLPGIEPDPNWVRSKAEKTVDTGVAPFPTMLLYYGSDWIEQLARWNINPPLLGTAMMRASR